MRKYKGNWYQKALNRVLSQNRKCEVCGAKETSDNIMLKYKNGLIMCDECFLNGLWRWKIMRKNKLKRELN